MASSHRVGESISPDCDAVVLLQPDGTYAITEAGESVCDHTHGDFEELADWLQRVRVEGEVLCPTCAHANVGTPKHLRKCVMCGQRAEWEEEAAAFSHRTRVFCESECQRSFYAHPTLPLAGVAPGSAFVIAGILKNETLDAARADRQGNMSQKEITNRSLFYAPSGGVAKLIRKHVAESPRAGLPEFPSIFQMLESMTELDDLCQDEMRIHYTYVSDITRRKGVFEIASTDAFKTSAPILSARLAIKMAKLVADSGRHRDQIKRLLNAKDLMVRHGRTEGIIDEHMEYVSILDIVNNLDFYNLRLSYGSQGLRVVLEYAEAFRRFSSDDTDMKTTKFTVLWRAILGEQSELYHPGTFLWDETVWQVAAQRLRDEPGFVDIDTKLLGSPLAVLDNYEPMNEAASGMRVSALVHAGISPAFTTVVDYFGCNANERGEPQRDLRLFVVQEAMDKPLAHHIKDLSAGDFDQALPHFQSILAQVLLALEAGQEHLKFVHNDLHVGNVMLGASPNTGAHVDYLQFRRPKELGDMFIPADILPDSSTVRIIDFGRSRVNHPMQPHDRNPTHIIFGLEFENQQDFKKIQANWEFDPWIDMRVFAYNLARSYLRRQWGGLFHDPTVPKTYGSSELLRVLEAMIGMSAWTDRTPMHFRAEAWEDALAPSFLNGVLARIIAAPPGDRLYTLLQITAEQEHVADERVAWLDIFYVLEAYGSRPGNHQAYDNSPEPSDVLNDGFFGDFRPSGVTMETFAVDFVGDATRRVGDGAGPPRGSVPSGPEKRRKRRATEEDESPRPVK